jgi:membrane protein
MPGFAKTVWPLICRTVTQWLAHKSPTLGAALAYYSVFSLGPLLVIAIAVAGWVYGQDAARNGIAIQLNDLLGNAGAQAVGIMLAAADQPRKGLAAGAIGIATLLFAAMGVALQLKDALNTIWDVKGTGRSGLSALLRSYLFALAMVISVGFLLLVSLVVTAAIAAAGKLAAPLLPEASVHVVTFITSFAVTAAVFAMMFKWLPDIRVDWGDVWLGAAFTAALFEIGKFLIGFYIGKLGLESTYGAAASLVVVLVWVYYNAQIVLLGAEFTHVFAGSHGSRRPARRTPARRENRSPTPTSVASTPNSNQFAVGSRDGQGGDT